MFSGSKIFIGYCVLGFVSDYVFFVMWYNKRLKENYVIISVGNVFYIYNVSLLI